MLLRLKLSKTKKREKSVIFLIYIVQILIVSSFPEFEIENALFIVFRHRKSRCFI